MIENELINSLDNCIDMLISGESVESCLTVYPMYATSLQPLLELGIRTRSTLGNSNELASAQRHVMVRMEYALNTPMVVKRPMYRKPLFLVGARAAAVLMIILISTVLLAQNSLPGDLLYSTKRLTEEINLTITGGSPEVQTAIEQRRRDEIKEVVRIGREVELVFTGEVEQILPDTIIVSNIVLKIQPETGLDYAYQVGDVVEVMAHSTRNGQLIGQQMRLIETHENRRRLAPPSLTPTATSSPTLTPTVSPSLTVSPRMTTVKTPNSISPTQKPQVTHMGPIDEIIPPLTPRSHHTIPEITTTACSKATPSGWYCYRIQAGDTLSGIAQQFNVSIETLIRVNCINNPSLITIGKEIFVPYSPVDSGDHRGSTTPDPANVQQDHRETATDGGRYGNDASDSDNKRNLEKSGTPEDKPPHGKP